MKRFVSPLAGAWAAVFLTLAAVPGTGDALEDLLDAAVVRALKGGDTPLEVQTADPRPLLAPRHDAVRRVVEDLRASLDPAFMVETLSLYTKPAGPVRRGWWTDLCNGVFALSTLAGLPYYSTTHHAVRALYETSQVIDSPASKKPLPDPVYATPPAALTLYARQKDASFGECVYRSDYTIPAAGGYLVAVQENMTALTYGIITAVKKNQLKSAVAVIDAGDYLLMYAVSMARASLALPGLKDRVGESVSARVAAMLTWFARQADKALL